MGHLNDGRRQAWRSRGGETIPGEGGQSQDEMTVSTRAAAWADGAKWSRADLILKQ